MVDSPTNVKQDVNLVPRKRPESAQLVAGAGAVSIPLSDGAAFLEISSPSDLVFISWDDTASATVFDAVVLAGAVRHLPIPYKSKPSSVSVFSASDFYAITI